MLPFAAPQPTGMMIPPDPEGQIGVDPQMLLRLLADLDPQEFKPKIPHNYKKEKKPTPQGIWDLYQREEARNAAYVAAMMKTLAYLRFDTRGIFDADQDARDLGDQDEWISSDLVDDWNLLCAILGSMDEGFVKKTLQRSNQIAAQTMEDGARLFREEMIYRWANTGDQPLPLAESRILTSYGKIAWRVLCNLDDPGFPFDVRLVDPASLYVIPGGTRGPRKVVRAMRMIASDAYAEWGEPKKEDRKKLENDLGRDDTTSLTVVEYADCTWRATVAKDGIELLPVVDHKYYSVPFVIQGGSAGEPLFTDTSRASLKHADRLSSGWWRSGPEEDWGMEHKLVSSIRAQIPRHDQLEAFMARVVTNIGDATNPAVVVTRDDLSANRPLPTIDRRRGRVNEIGMGETMQPVPNLMNPQDVNMVMANLNQDRQTGGIPLGMYGAQPGSNITGNSMSVAAESGMDHIVPWIQALETGRTRVIERMFEYYRNKGHLSRFYDGDEKPFMVPVSKPTTTGELARALTPQIIDAVGPRVRVVMSRLRVQEAIQWAQVASQLVPLGVPMRRFSEKFGFEDYDRMREEWQEEQDWSAMNADETLMKEVRIPMKLHQMAEDAQTDEERALAMALLDRYMAMREMEAQAAMQPQVAPGMAAPGGPPPGAPPLAVGPGGAPMAGLGANTLNFAGVGAAPGSAGAPVGRPPGPFGP